MADRPRSPTTDLYNILGISKDLCKASKFLFVKWLPDKSPTKKIGANAKPIAPDEEFVVIHGTKDDERTTSNGHPTSARLSYHQNDDDSFFMQGRSFSPRSGRRRSKTPTPSPPSPMNGSSRRCTTPLSELLSRRSSSETEIPFPFLSRNTSGRSSSETDIHLLSSSENMNVGSPHETRSSMNGSSRGCTTPLSELLSRESNSETETPFPFLSRNTSGRSSPETETHFLSSSENMNVRSPHETRSSMNGSSRSCTTPLSELMNRRSNSETEIPFPFLSRNTSGRSSSETDIHFLSSSENMNGRSPCKSRGSETKSKSRRSSSETEASVLGNMSSLKPEKPPPPRETTRRSPTPIIFSQSTAPRKPPPVEKKLKCTLEELSEGCVKKIKITRNVITNTGLTAQEEEKLKIQVQPGWKKGTKVTFEGKGDEKPGYLPADVIFVIDERIHPLFTREGDDLEIGVKIPLLKALTGCSIPVPLLGGEKMTLSFDDIIYPGYEKVIRGQGMPNSREPGRRGDLRIKFLVEFPTELSEEQRAEALRALEDCS